MNKYKVFLLLPLMAIVFNGCIANNLYTLHTHGMWNTWDYQDTLPKIDNSITVSLDTQHKSTKIYIDNSIDVIRKEAFMNELYKELLKEDTINLWRNHHNVEENNNYVEVYDTYVKINSTYSYDVSNLCIIDCPKKVIDVTKWKRVDDGVALYTKIDSNFIMGLLYQMPTIGIHYDIEVPYKLDTTSMDNGIAHFTDEYLRRFSLKELLTKELSDKGFIVVNNQKEADIVIATENLTFASINNLVEWIPYPKIANLELNELSTLQNKPYYTFPVKVVSFSDLFNTNIKVNNGVGYVHPSGAGLAVAAFTSGVRGIGGAISTINYLTVYYKNRRLGSIVDLTMANKKNRYVQIQSILGKPAQNIDISEVLSDELIDELNTQAAKQVLDKIRFVEK